MELNDRDIDWQKDAPTLAAIGKVIPFTVPAGYFEDLSGNLKARLLIESMRTEDQDGFKVPGNYFKELSSRIEESVTIENLKVLAPSDGFTLPEGYFADLSERINIRVEKSAKQNTPVRRLFTSWVSYAAAACITAVIATGIYFNSDTRNFNEQLSEVPDQEIINYLQAHSTAGDTPFIIETLNPEELGQVTPEVSADELEQYINTTTL